MGNALRIAYGGFALAVALKAACYSVPSGYHLYSFMGNYLGPASVDRCLYARVRDVRQTRSFATRHVEVYQVLDSDSEASKANQAPKERICLFATSDFHIQEPAGTLLSYHCPPRREGGYTHHTLCPAKSRTAADLLAAGKISQSTHDAFTAAFALNSSLFDIKMCPEGIFAQNLSGHAKSLPHSQDHLPLPSRTSADWFRATGELPSQTEQLAALAFYADGALSFCPLSFSHMYLEDSGACSSLDFSLRVFGDVDLERWHLREVGTHVGAQGRTYSEAWIWDEEGRAVACMSQQSILRVLPGKGKGKL
ncbi:hypothetical protein EKO04_001475 [Ascochyta lentis]|uniref:Thioesterase-like superfamily-domain-containing protein n=1 Tax=Ascochyta lentis TaxID=205686 RepID=A0A8H7MHA2_9PLEO|nr:hypothetical protein EKO04_001475 [Ascochyta lentis]